MYNKDNGKGVFLRKSPKNNKGGENMPKNSKAKIVANNRYNQKNYDHINIAVKKGDKEIIKAHAEKHGESINGFVKRAIKETMTNDNKTGKKIDLDLSSLLDGW